MRVEVGKGISRELRDELIESLEIESRDVYEIDGMLDLNDLWQIVKLPGHKELRDAPWSPVVPSRLRDADGEPVPVMAAMRNDDILVHHPYESFSASVERFVAEAVNDPDVLAIKMTVYRTSDDSPLVPALIRASERGKQAVALVELKARFDERANIQWARELEQSGVHVVYGPPALKTHTKCVLVVRREGNRVRHYVHIGTGNYHSDDGAALHRLRSVHDRPADRRRRHRHVQLPDRLRASARDAQGADRARARCARASSTRSTRRSRRTRRRIPAGS